MLGVAAGGARAAAVGCHSSSGRRDSGWSAKRGSLLAGPSGAPAGTASSWDSRWPTRMPWRLQAPQDCLIQCAEGAQHSHAATCLPDGGLQRSQYHCMSCARLHLPGNQVEIGVCRRHSCVTYYSLHLWRMLCMPQGLHAAQHLCQPWHQATACSQLRAPDCGAGGLKPEHQSLRGERGSLLPAGAPLQGRNAYRCA